MKPTFTYLSIQRFSRTIKTFSFLLFFSLIAHAGFAQKTTITFNLLKAPCNNDGILVVQTTGLMPPIAFTISQTTGSVVDTLNSVNDTLLNYGGGFVSVGATGAPGSATGSQGYFTAHPPFTFNIISTSAACPALGSLKAVSSGGTAPYTAQWFTQTNHTSVVATGDSVSLKAGNYDVQITDAHGCVTNSFSLYPAGSGTNSYDSIAIKNITPLRYSFASTVPNCTNGTISLSNVSGGHTPYSFQWSNGAITPVASGLVQGEYSFTITDAQGCIADSFAYLRQAVTITVNTTPTNPTCIQTDGSAIAFGSGGVSPYTYLWNGGQQTQAISNLATGSYIVSVTDSRGCIGSGYVSLTGTSPITITYAATSSLCTSPTGTATLKISGGQSPYAINWYTFPSPQSTGTATNSPGVYGFLVTDANKCIKTGSVYVPPVSVITAAIFKTDAVCTQANGGANVTASSTAAPLTYQWSTGGTGASIAGLPVGGYSCTVTDKMGCSVNKSIYVEASSPLNLTFASTQASCLFTNDATVTAVISGGTLPYNYNWSSGQTTATSTGLEQGRYYAYVSDAAGCVQNGYTNVGYDASNNSCYCTVSGSVYNDLNANCTLDNNEPGIQNIMIHLSGLGYTYTDANGNYSILAPSGNYTLSEDVEAYYPLASCQTNSIPVTVTASSGCVIPNNFANVINPIHDLSIYTTSNTKPPIPGFTYQQTVVIKNNGTVTEDSILSIYANDGQLSTASFVPSIFTQQTSTYYSITPGDFSLAPGTSQTFSINYNVPTNIPLGTVLNYNDTVVYHSPVANWLLDYSPWNNVSAYQNIVVGSFDPNEKEVTPLGTGPQGLISNTDSVLTYTIHFQNTGTYPAQNIVVIDTLDKHLDMTTVKPGFSNYSYTTTMSEKGVLTFTFNNINLPDSFTNKVGSVGTVSYSVHQKAGNAPGTHITSPASIYFDYNKPVKTNAPLNTLEDLSTGVKEAAAKVFDLTVYPNPSSAGKVSLLINTTTSSPTSTVGIYDLLGKLLQTKTVSLTTGKNIISEDVSKLTPGLYFVKLDEGKKSLVQKLTVVK